MDGKGNAYHSFTTAIIAAASTMDDKEPLHPVLKGATISEEEPFQSELFQVEEEIEDGQSSDIDEIINEIDKITEELEETLLDEPFREAPAAAAGPKAPAVPPQADNAAEVPSTPQAENAEERIVSKRTYNNFYNEYILSACAHTCRVAEFYEDAAPFERDRTGARWKKIVNIANLPLVSPGAHYFATQYRHYIFGAKPDEKGYATKFFFGIPGRFLDEEQPDGGRSGFTYWQPIRGADPVFESYRKGERSNRNAYGYWIVAVDGKTGNIEEV
jgi:hypothetical protein